MGSSPPPSPSYDLVTQALMKSSDVQAKAYSDSTSAQQTAYDKSSDVQANAYSDSTSAQAATYNDSRIAYRDAMATQKDAMANERAVYNDAFAAVKDSAGARAEDAQKDKEAYRDLAKDTMGKYENMASKTIEQNTSMMATLAGLFQSMFSTMAIFGSNKSNGNVNNVFG